MRRSTVITTVSVIALLAAGHAAAQQATPLRLGQQVQGSLTAEDSRIDSEEVGRFVYDDYSIRGRDGQRLEITLRAADFDAYLEVFESGSDDVMAFDDDGLQEDGSDEHSTNSRLRFAPGDADYIIRARTLSGFEGGDYTLQVTDRGSPPPAPRPMSVSLGESVDGDIGADDPVEEGGDAYSEYSYDAYAFRARQGDRVAISLDSDDFDPILRVGRMTPGDTFEELAQNDDNGSGGLNSWLVFHAPADGDYVIRAAPLDGGATGAYTLGLAEGPPPIAMQPIALGATVEGELSSDDGANDSGQRADVYSFTALAGQRIVATLSSDAFDTYLELFAESADEGGRYSVDSDDDGAGEGTDSRLSYTFAEGGDYTLEARAFSGEGEGAYTLTFVEAEPLPEPTDLAFGATVQGEIDEGDPRDEENRGFDAYRFTGEAGNRIQAIMRSGDFDSYLQVGSPEGEFYALASDDDGLGEGTDSRLNFILPSSGEFILRALPLFGDAEGLYSLELIDRGPQPTPGSILIDATARGALGEDDAIADDGSFYDAYRFSAKAGDKLRLTMVSNEFDAFIDIGREDDDGAFISVVSDDDSLSDTHAKVDWAVEEDGDYVIRARSFAQGQSGAYALTVERKE